MIDVAQRDYVAIKISEGIQYVLSFVLCNAMFVATHHMKALRTVLSF